MVCLKATADALEELSKLPVRQSEFVDEDLDDMRTAIAVGPLTRDEGYELFGKLSLA